MFNGIITHHYEAKSAKPKNIKNRAVRQSAHETNYRPPYGHVNKYPSARCIPSGSDFETGEVHAVWSLLFIMLAQIHINRTDRLARPSSCCLVCAVSLIQLVTGDIGPPYAP